MSREVAVTGLGMVTAVGDGADETWAALTTATSGAGHVTRFDTEKYAQCVDIACEVPTDPTAHPQVTPNRMGTYTQYAIIAAHEALADADLDPTASSWEPATVGVSLGTAVGGLPEQERGALSLADNDRLSPRFMLEMLPNLAPGHVSIQYDAGGPTRSNSTACAAGTQSLIDAADDIRLGRADVMIAGGAEAAICPAGIAGFGAMRALSTQTEDPQSASRPFDTARDGFVLGEGAGILVLEAREHAAARGVEPLAILSGTGLSSDAAHPTSPHEEAWGLIRAMEMALTDADCEPSMVDLVNAHATSTPRGDAHEAQAITDVFDAVPPVTAPKSMVGHPLGASGGIEAAISVQAIRERCLPPTINYETRDPACDVPVVTDPTATPVDTVVSNSAGFGGSNAVIVLEAP